MSKVRDETSRNDDQESTSSAPKAHADIGSNNVQDRYDGTYSSIDDALHHESLAGLLMTSKQMAEVLLYHQFHSAPAFSLSRADSSVVVPINDIDGAHSANYSKNEQLIRCKLASLYRLIDLHKFSQGIYNHITVRATEDHEHFLINPFGLLYNEITASSLVKVDISGAVIDPGSTTFGINHAGYTLHSAIHKARPDLKCVIHLHTPAVVATSAMKCGLLALSQEALFCGKISYHDYRGILIDQHVKEIIVEDLGSINKVMILRNHGFVACGETVEEAWRYAVNMIKASEVQARAASVGIDQLYLQLDEKDERIANVLQGNMDESSGNNKWKTGELEFECLMRILDDAGYRTGYSYRQPLNHTIDRATTNTNVKVAPSTSPSSLLVNNNTIIS